MCRGGGQNNMARGVDIPWVGVQIHVHFVIKLNIFYLYVDMFIYTCKSKFQS